VNPKEHSKKRRWSRWIIILGCLLVIILIFLALWFYTPLLRAKPQVRIVQPENRIAIQSGDAIILKIEGVARNGFKKIIFLVDEGFLSQETFANPNPQNLDLSFPWFSSRPGVHKLSVVAYDSKGTPSEPANLLVMVTPQAIGQINQNTDPTPEGDQQGESLDPETEGNALEEGLDNQQSESLDSDAEANASEDGLNNQQGEQALEENLGNLDWFINEVDENNEFPLELPNSEADEIPLITQFEISTDRGGAQTSGTFTIVASDDIGLISINFFLANLDEPLNPFTREMACGGEVSCRMNGDFQLAQGGWLLSAQAMDVSGQVSELSSHQIHILIGDDPQAVAEGDEESLINLDPEIPWDEVELIEVPTDDIGVPLIAEYGCSGQIVFIDVPYTYVSDHGDDVYLGATAESGNIMVAAGHAKILPGVGVVRIEMEPIAPDMADQTNELELYFRMGTDYFYNETVPLTINWPIPEPDLTITNVNQDEALVSVSVKNLGCSSAHGFEIAFNLADNQVFTETVDQWLSPGAQYTWESFVNPNLFSRGFETVVDPNNTIVEIDEVNNAFSLAPISIAYVEVYRVDIHDISEGWLRGNKGEFQFEVEVNDRYLRSPAGDTYFWSRGEGTFMIENSPEPIFLHPELRWDEDLYFVFYGWEDDDLTRDPLGHVVQVYSFDMFNEKNWKQGGEFFAKSDYKFYTVYWRIVLNDRH